MHFFLDEAFMRRQSYGIPHLWKCWCLPWRLARAHNFPNIRRKWTSVWDNNISSTFTFVNPMSRILFSCRLHLALHCQPQEQSGCWCCEWYQVLWSSMIGVVGFVSKHWVVINTCNGNVSGGLELACGVLNCVLVFVIWNCI